MKNEQMIAAWDGILPDAAAETRMRTNIMAYQRKGRKRVHPAIPAAACLLLAACAGFGIYARWFAARPYSVTLESGDTMVYQRSSFQTAAQHNDVILPENVQSRNLTADELQMLFSPLGQITEQDSAFAYFRGENGAAFYLEGTVGGVRIHLAEAGFPVNDAVIAGEEAACTVGGIAVKTGYFLTKANSSGIRTAIFCAQYETDGITVYAELAGAEEQREQLSETLSETVCRMIGTQTPDLSAVRYQ